MENCPENSIHPCTMILSISGRMIFWPFSRAKVLIWSTGPAGISRCTRRLLPNHVVRSAAAGGSAILAAADDGVFLFRRFRHNVQNRQGFNDPIIFAQRRQLLMRVLIHTFIVSLLFCSGNRFFLVPGTGDILLYTPVNWAVFYEKDHPAATKTKFPWSPQ